MQPRHDMRFCTTADGVRIASATTGSGSVLVRVGTWIADKLKSDQHEHPCHQQVEAPGIGAYIRAVSQYCFH